MRNKSSLRVHGCHANFEKGTNNSSCRNIFMNEMAMSYTDNVQANEIKILLDFNSHHGGKEDSLSRFPSLLIHENLLLSNEKQKRTEFECQKSFSN
jgi:hypothetical protein